MVTPTACEVPAPRGLDVQPAQVGETQCDVAWQLPGVEREPRSSPSWLICLNGTDESDFLWTAMADSPVEAEGDHYCREDCGDPDIGVELQVAAGGERSDTVSGKTVSAPCQLASTARPRQHWFKALEWLPNPFWTSRRDVENTLFFVDMQLHRMRMCTWRMR